MSISIPTVFVRMLPLLQSKMSVSSKNWWCNQQCYRHLLPIPPHSIPSQAETILRRYPKKVIKYAFCENCFIFSNVIGNILVLLIFHYLEILGHEEDDHVRICLCDMIDMRNRWIIKNMRMTVSTTINKIYWWHKICRINLDYKV